MREMLSEQSARIKRVTAEGSNCGRVCLPTVSLPAIRVMGDTTEEKTDVKPERKVTIAQLAKVVLHRPIVDLTPTKEGSLLALASETVQPMKREEETQTRRRAVK